MPIQVSCGPLARKLADRMTRLAASRRNMLVYGQTGVGKELMLRTYVDHPEWGGGGRIINCAAIPAELLESELFGFEKGAFTGATRAKAGLVESCNCLGLDEIGDATPQLQAKILRVMESGDYFRLGDPNPRHTDVVFVAATNKPEALRSDLLWRFGARVRVPPISERRGDLVEVLHHVAYQIGIQSFTERCVGFLIEEYEWPGNVREMRYVLSEANEIAEDRPVDLWDLPIPVIAYQYTDIPKKWANSEDPGRTWRVDDSFVARARDTFPSSIDDETVALGLERLTYLSLMRQRTEGEAGEQTFRRELLGALDRIAGNSDSPEPVDQKKTAPGADLSEMIVGARTWNEAAALARTAWYEARRLAGKRRVEIARELGVTVQALGQALKRYGIKESPTATRSNRR